MQKLLQNFNFGRLSRLALSFCLVMVMAMNVGWGQTATLVSGSGSGTSDYSIPEGWTLSGTVEGGSYLKFDNGTITSPEFAPHNGLSFTYSVAAFGSGTNHPLTIRILDASTNAVIEEKTTATPTSSSYINTGSPLSLGDVTVAFKIQMYGPTGKGVRLRNYSVTGTPAGSSSGGGGGLATLTQSNLGLTGSYTTNTSKTVDGITYVYTDLMKNNGNIQAKASTGTIKNTTPYPGDITSVVITHSGTERTTTINGSADGTTWTQVATGNGSITADFSGRGFKYFQITRGANAAQWTKIEINYSASGTSQIASDLAITNTSTELTFDLYNNSTAQVINYTTSSTGAITITPASSDYFTYAHDATNKTITVTPTAVTPSAQTVTISQAADDDYYAGTATFTVSVANSDPNVPGTQNNPYTVAQARAAIDAGTGTQGVYATGIVSENNYFSSSNGYITYFISADGSTESAQLEAFHGMSFNGAPFSSANEIQVGDSVVIHGNLTKYHNDNTNTDIYEFESGNQLISLVRPAQYTLTNAMTNVAEYFVFVGDDEIEFNENNQAQVTAGTTIYVSLTMEDCYALTSLTVNGSTTGVTEEEPGVYYSFVMPEGDATIGVLATQATQYTLTVVGGESVTFDMLTGAESNTVSLTNSTASICEQMFVTIANLTANPGLILQSVTLTAGGNTTTLTLEDGVYHFNMPSSNATLTFTTGTPPTYTLANSIVSGKNYIIVGFDDNHAYAMGVQNTNNRAGVGITVDGNTATGNAEVHEVVITALGGDDEGKYTIEDGGYLYASSSSSNYLKTEETLDDNGKWTIGFAGNGDATITAQGSNSRKLMRFNPNTSNNNPFFACYATTSTTGSLPRLYVKDEISTEPSITVESTTITAPVAGISNTLTVTYNNITEVLAEVQFCDAQGNVTTYDWITATINSDNNIEYTVSANTGAARTAYFKVYALDDEVNDVYSDLITVTQAAVPPTVYFFEGTGDCDVVSLTGYSITLPTATISSTDWTFSGWAAAPVNETTTAPTLYPANTNYVPTADTKLYAVYSMSSQSGTGASVYQKVTSQPADWSGEYLIVYETLNNNVEDVAWIFNGADAASDYVEVGNDNETITQSTLVDKLTISITSMTGGYSLKINAQCDNNPGKFISGLTGNSNGIEFNNEAVANTITWVNDDNTVIIESNNKSFRFNANSGNERFRFFKSTTSGTGYYCPSLYKLSSAVSLVYNSFPTVVTTGLDVTEGFEGYTTANPSNGRTMVKPTGWTVVTQYDPMAKSKFGRPEVYYCTPYAHSGSYSLFLDSLTLLAMPKLAEGIVLSNIEMELYVRQPFDFQSLEVGVISDLTDPESSFEVVATINTIGSAVNYRVVDFSGYQGSGRYIAFRNKSSQESEANGMRKSFNYLDDIVLKVNESTCGITTLPYTQDFDALTDVTAERTGVQPECWTEAQKDANYTATYAPQLFHAAAYAHSGDYTLLLDGRGIYAMPELKAHDANDESVSVSDLEMEFYVRQPYAQGVLQVGVMTDLNNPNSFVMVSEISNDGVAGQQKHVVDFSSYEGSGKYIAFRNVYNGTWGRSPQYIDDIDLHVKVEDNCGITSLPYTLNFDEFTDVTTERTGVQPECWSMVKKDVNYADTYAPQLFYCAPYAHSGSYTLLLDGRGIYAMPELKVNDDVQDLRLEFYVRQPYAQSSLQVGVMTDVNNPSTFVVLEIISNEGAAGQQQHTVNFSDYVDDIPTGAKYIAFRNIYDGTWGRSPQYLDDITLSLATTTPDAVAEMPQTQGEEPEEYVDDSANTDFEEVMAPTGISDFDLSNLTVYPNPTTGMVTIVADEVSRVEVYNQIGVMVARYTNERVIDLGNLSNGVYMLRVTMPQGVAIRKVVKK